MSSKANKRNLPAQAEAKKNLTRVKVVKQKNPKRRRPRNATENVISGKYSTYRGENASTNNISASASSIVELVVPIDNNAISSTSRAFVNYALSRAWNSNDQLGYVGWYYALCRLNEIFSAYCTGSQIQGFQSLPRCVVQLGNLLKPKKNLPYYGGKISLSWTGNVQASTQWQYSAGPSTNTAVSNYGIYGSNDASTGYPTVINPGAYPSGNPADASLQSMFSFCQSMATTPQQRHFWENIPANEDIPDWSSDPVAFSAVQQVDGDVAGSAGGYATIIRSELPCKRLLFAGFSAQQSPATIFARFPGKQYTFAGDLLTNVGLYVTQTVADKELKMRRAPVLKSIDVEELIDVLAQYCSEVLTKAANDPLVSTGQVSVPQCPLNYYAMRYMFRNDLMFMFNSTQPFVSNIFPQSSTNGHFDFTSLQVGTGLFGVTSSTANYPEYLIENIRCLSQRIMYNTKGGKLNPVIYTPVLVAPSKSEPNWKDYTYDVLDGNNVTTTLQVFTDPGSVGDPSIIDGALQSGYVSMSDADALALYAENWNDWLKKVGTYSCALTSASLDSGPFALITCSQWEAPRLNQLKKQDSKSKLTVGEIMRAKLRKTMSVPPIWEETVLTAITSYAPILDALTPILFNFVLPASVIQVASTDSSTHIAATEQGRTKEMSRITQFDQWGSNLTHKTMGQKHKLFAIAMTKAREAPDSVMDQLFKIANERGAGGILSSLLGNVVKGLLPSEAHGIVDTVASIVPF